MVACIYEVAIRHRRSLGTCRPVDLSTATKQTTSATGRKFNKHICFHTPSARTAA